MEFRTRKNKRKHPELEHLESGTKEYRRLYDKLFRPETKRKRHRRRYERLKKNHPEKLKAKQRRDNANYAKKPENQLKRLARWATHNAIRRGRITREPCEKCGSVKSQAHHIDYSQPMRIRWLCRPCHLAVHEYERGAA